MAVSYKRLLHMMIEKDVSNAQLMHDAGISANIITKLKTVSILPWTRSRVFVLLWDVHRTIFWNLFRIKNDL